MHNELESHVWLLVQKTCDQSMFAQLIDDAVCSYKRKPGLDTLVRLHASDVGLTCIRTLQDVLKLHGIDVGNSESYIELRLRLKTHLRDHVQWYLVENGIAGDALKDDQLAKDLGL
ncbi:hypothetical protein [Pseudomonas sp. NPDC089569]|uniref:hypothetical protein n=1 Tax=Pseudomonas sp. NPDC089569 TaxID=3390722 RepID=UPI003D038FD2